MDRSRPEFAPVKFQFSSAGDAVDRARFTIFSDIQSTTLFARPDARIFAKNCSEIQRTACEVFFVIFFYHEFISGNPKICRKRRTY